MSKVLTRVVLVLLGCLLGGCGFLSQRGEDFLDIWRADLHSFSVPGVWVHAGPILHTGLGSTRLRYHGPAPGIGHIYNQQPSGEAACSDVYILLYHFSSAAGLEPKKDGHKCLGILPGLFHTGAHDRPVIHLFDIEVGVNLFIIGVDAGFSPGQLLDFLLGWFGIDIAEDDAPAARRKRSGTGEAGKPEKVAGFSKNACVELTQRFEDLAAGTHGHVLGEQAKGSGIVVDFSGVRYVVPATLLRAAKAKNK